MNRLKTIAIVVAVLAVAAYLFIAGERERNAGRVVSPAASNGVSRSTLDLNAQVICTEVTDGACASVEYQGLTESTWNGEPAYQTTYKFHMKDGGTALFTGWFRKADGKYLESVSLTR